MTDLRLPCSIAVCLMQVVMTAFLTSTVVAQGPIPFESVPRGGVRQFDGHSMGVYQTAPGVRDYGDTPQTAGPSYFGIMGAVATGNAGTYSATPRRIGLGELVRAANGLSGSATGMAQIIRNGRVAIHVFPNANELPHLLPGDLVVFQREVNQRGQDEGEGVRVASETIGDDVERVEIALLGIKPSRPIVVWPERKDANIAGVISLLHQREELASTVRVIRTDSRTGILPPGQQPRQLVDGDVLVFDPQAARCLQIVAGRGIPARDSHQQRRGDHGVERRG